MEQEILSYWKLYGMPSAGKLRNTLSNIGKKYTLKQIKDVLDKQIIEQVFRSKRKKKSEFTKIEAPTVGYLQLDLLEFGKNDLVYKYVVNVLDVATRYAWCYPIGSKTPENVLEKVLIIQDELSDWGGIKSITMDQGNEFKGVFKEWLLGEGIDIYIVDEVARVKNHNRLGLIDRFSRTLRKLVGKFMLANDQHWAKYVKRAVNAYNEQYHEALKESPADMLGRFHKSMKELSPEAFIEKKEKTQYISNKKFIGKTVRIVIRKQFHRAHQANYSKETYTVEKTVGGKLKLSDGNIYSPSDLLIVK
jgi:hypothetical protein